MTIVIKLPGAGMIKMGPSTSSIDWLSYRDYRIDADFYRDLLKLISSQDNTQQWVIVSGGVGSHLQTNFAREMHASADELKAIGTDHVRTLQKVFLSYCSRSGASVHEVLVPVTELNAVMADSRATIFFVDPDIRYASTDTLAAAAAQAIAADKLIVFKAKVPVFSAGFPTPTRIEKWPIADLGARAESFEAQNPGHYIMDSASVQIIRSAGISTWLLAPDNYIALFDPEQCESATEIVL
jgi:uridylate kinase